SSGGRAALATPTPTSWAGSPRCRRCCGCWSSSWRRSAVSSPAGCGCWSPWPPSHAHAANWSLAGPRGGRRTMDEVAKAVEECARAAKLAAPSLAAASTEAVDAALTGMAERLLAHRDEILEANQADVGRAKADGMSAGLLDRLTITPERLTGMAEQLRLLAGA